MIKVYTVTVRRSGSGVQYDQEYISTHISKDAAEKKSKEIEGVIDEEIIHIPQSYYSLLSKRDKQILTE